MIILVILASLAGVLFLRPKIAAEVGPRQTPRQALNPAYAAVATSTRSARVPIFVYHLVRPAELTDTPDIRAYLVTPDVFELQMRYLHDNKYHVISFSDLENYLNDGVPLPSRPVILSFDDGWENQFAYAFPILQKYHLTATFFIFTNAMGHREYLSWSQVQTLLEAGMTIGSHTRSHPYLAQITDQTKLEDEIAGSKQIIEAHTGTTTNEFAYPFSSYSTTTIALVKKAGYKSARAFSLGVLHTRNDLYTLSTVPGPNDLFTFIRYLPR